MVHSSFGSALPFSLLLLLSLVPFATVASPSTTLDFPQAPCPFVHGCNCIDDDATQLECSGIGAATVSVLERQFPAVKSLKIKGWDQNSQKIDLAVFQHLTNLQHLSLTEGKLVTIKASSSLDNLKRLNLSSNWIYEFQQLCNVSLVLPSLNMLDLSGNYLMSLHPCIDGSLHVNSLVVSNNKLTHLNCTFHEELQSLDLSRNSLAILEGLPTGIQHLNVSQNPLEVAEMPQLDSLKTIDMSGTSFYLAPSLRAPKVEEVLLDESSINLVDLASWKVGSLKRLSLSNCHSLTVLAGQLPSSVTNFAMTKTRVTSLPQQFFAKVSPATLSLSLADNSFDCDACAMQWAEPVAPLMMTTNCTIPSKPENCSIGISSEPALVFGRYGHDTILPCNVYGIPQPTVEWWLFRPSTFIGRFDPATQVVDRGNASEETKRRFGILGGALLIHDANRTSVERYVCVVRNEHGHEHKVIPFRLDYSDWYSLSPFDSVFWGALAFCIVLCAFSFLLNITWILTRKSILWWIQRAERLSRVRKMVEAMEKYRTRQMESLHDRYTRRVQLVRDNYHQQVEQLRVSYSSQAERFRDYRAAQMESMTSHLENIRDNYQQQMNRMRDFGSKRAEQLWESYERQVNRMRAFSLQHRLKLMRQYKVKQRYLNKLLESVQDDHSPEAMRKHEEEVRAALELPDNSVDPHGDDVSHPLSRSSSFYSLPEYIIDENGQLRPSPLVPTVRFTREIRGGRDVASGSNGGGGIRDNSFAAHSSKDNNSSVTTDTTNVPGSSNNSSSTDSAK